MKYKLYQSYDHGHHGGHTLHHVNIKYAIGRTIQSSEYEHDVQNLSSL